MAYSKNRRLADLVATDGTMDAAKLKSGTVTQAHLHSSHGITTCLLYTSPSPRDS